jgi:hypothetical protein
MITSRQQRLSLGAHLRRQAPRLWRAASRRWGLTARYGQAKWLTVPLMMPHPRCPQTQSAFTETSYTKVLTFPKPHPGRTAAPPSDAPEPKAQRNFTDPESRILKTKDGYIQGYNAQAAVDAEAQVIVAHTLSNNGSDQAQFAPLLDGIKTNLGRNPDEASADAGYCSAANLRTLSRRRIKGYIATGRQKHGAKSATSQRRTKPGSLLARMTTRLKRAGHRSRYRLRKQVVEPAFGQIKQARGFRQFLLRGIEKVKAEWAMICTAHNLRKLALAAA